MLNTIYGTYKFTYFYIISQELRHFYPIFIVRKKEDPERSRFTEGLISHRLNRKLKFVGLLPLKSSLSTKFLLLHSQLTSKSNVGALS